MMTIGSARLRTQIVGIKDVIRAPLRSPRGVVPYARVSAIGASNAAALRRSAQMDELSEVGVAVSAAFSAHNRHLRGGVGLGAQTATAISFRHIRG